MNESKIYTAADIERYYSGKLSVAERHALEKAALGDPFLADALEGYATTQTPAADIAALQQLLQLRIKKEKEKHGIFYGNNWMKIAASVILIVGLGWVFFQTNEAKEKVAGAPAVQKNEPVVKLDKTLDSSLVVYNNAPQKSTQYQTKVEEQQAPIAKKKDAGGELVPGYQYKIPATVYAAPAGRADSASNRDLVLNEVTVERKKESPAFKNSTAAPLQGRTSGLIVVQKKAASVADKDAPKGSALPDTIKNFDVTLKPTELPADQTVLLNQKERSVPTAKRMHVMVDSLEPAEGWTNFDDYIAQNLKEPSDLKIKGLKGEVELSFEVNKEGEAVNIAVTKSLCEKCDDEAVRLLKEGPKWKKNKKKGKVTIKFLLVP